MKNNRITPESQRTRLPFAMFLYIALAAVIVLGFVHTIGYILIDTVGSMDAIINYYLYFEDVNEGVIFEIVMLIGNVVSHIVAEALPLVLCVFSVIIALLMLFRKRNLLLFIPTAILTLIFGSAAVLGMLAVVLLFFFNLISLFAFDGLSSYSNDVIFMQILDYIIGFIRSFGATLSTTALAIAFAALSLLFISCGKGVIGIFKRAKKLCFIIFCIALCLCILFVGADLLVSVFWHLQNLVRNFLDFMTLVNIWDYYIAPYAALISTVVLPIYAIFDTRLIMIILCLIAVFFTGLWLYKPHLPVKKKKKKKIDLVEYVELEYGDDNEVTMEVVDGDNDDEFVNISVHRQKTHDDE